MMRAVATPFAIIKSAGDATCALPEPPDNVTSIKYRPSGGIPTAATGNERHIISKSTIKNRHRFTLPTCFRVIVWR
jgi:hypothetical protein